MKPDLTSIQNIIFDLGGVILNINPQLTVMEMQKLGIRNFDQIYSQLKQHHIFDRLEKGELSEDDFVKTIREYAGLELSHEEIIRSWNELLLDYPAERISLLKQLKQSDRYRTFLLSNTNAIHKDVYTQSLKEQFGIDGLEALFDKAYFSHEIGMRKPDNEIFEYVMKDSNLNPQKTLFIDDSEANLTGAQKLGIQTFQVTQKRPFTVLFAEG